MRRRYLWLGAVALAVVTAAVGLVALPRAQEWTTSSPAALAAFEAGIDAQRKLYSAEAAEHFARAVDLDPGFVVAKMYLADGVGMSDGDEKRARALFDEVVAADLTRLRSRERFLVERWIAGRQRRFDEQARLLDEYLAEHPNDPWAVYRRARELWERGDFEDADRWFRRLLELDPNWVIAYNQLGYIAMQQGRFAEAEEYFTSYRFIAPDQANPHDSLGELYLTQGRYEEAETSFESALRIKPDFWFSYYHLAVARALMDDHQGARDAIARMASQDGAPPPLLAAWTCEVRMRELEARRRWSEMLDDDSMACVDKAEPWSYAAVAAQRAAAQLGHWQVEEKISARLRELLEGARREGASNAFDEGWPSLLHMEGVKSVFQNDLGVAEQKFREADARLNYLKTELALLKISNQIMLVETLLAQGKDAEAHSLLARVRAVNPVWVAEFQEQGNTVLGLKRG